mmetsp:Transcript_7061/g.16883  ORF Transcript_7061/g.16883 Transcript_7061/m.16883 type:complete len:243 (-) Transcript_7061:32-760(-)
MARASLAGVQVQNGLLLDPLRATLGHHHPHRHLGAHHLSAPHLSGSHGAAPRAADALQHRGPHRLSRVRLRDRPNWPKGRLRHRILLARHHPHHSVRRHHLRRRPCLSAGDHGHDCHRLPRLRLGGSDHVGAGGLPDESAGSCAVLLPGLHAGDGGLHSQGVGGVFGLLLGQSVAADLWCSSDHGGRRGRGAEPARDRGGAFGGGLGPRRNDPGGRGVSRRSPVCDRCAELNGSLLEQKPQA